MARGKIPAVFIDSDVLIAGAASPAEHGASMVILRLAEITLIDAYTSEQVITEATRNLGAKFPRALPAFHHLVSRCLTIVQDPTPSHLEDYEGLADPKDLPILVAALAAGCSWLVSFNQCHYQPGHADFRIVNPGELILRIRDQLAHL
jgi:predicted nucleic acid-binding protein